MKIYIAAFIALTLPSLSNADLTFVHGSRGTTMINSIGDQHFISHPDGTMSSAMTIGNDIYVFD